MDADTQAILLDIGTLHLLFVSLVAVFSCATLLLCNAHPRFVRPAPAAGCWSDTPPEWEIYQYSPSSFSPGKTRV